MVEGEDTLVFIEAFQATALACHWPEDEWAARLLPLLSGEAQTAALSLPPGSRKDVRGCLLGGPGPVGPLP